jgi:DNA polymerase-3 subunit delta'
MAGFAEIVGHEKIIAHLQKAVTTGQVSHAYIFDGPDRSGKKMLAEAFAMALQCEAGTGEACMACRSCHQALGHNQPDIIYVTHEKPNTISVSDVREQLNGDISIRPYSSRYKIYIVDEAEKMNVQAQNALLKTLEEPPSYAVILLLTNNAAGFLQTIRSRCVMLSLKAVPSEQIRQLLMRSCQIPDYEADICAGFAQGNVGKAIALAGSERFRELKDLALRQIRRLADTPDYELSDLVEELCGLTEDTGEYLDLLQMWYRDVLYDKAAGNTEGLIFRDQQAEVSRQSGRISYRGLELILEAVDTARRRIHANVKKELTLELMLMTIKENIK